MPWFTAETPQQLDWTSWSNQLADPVYPLPPSGDDIKEPHKRVHFSVALLQMPRHHCKTCWTPLHADDSHALYVSCLGNPHANTTLSGADCFYSESFSLTSLRSQIAFFSESDSAPRALPFSSSQGHVRKNSGGRGFERLKTSEFTSAQCPPEVERVQKYSTQVKVPLHYWNFT